MRQFPMYALQKSLPRNFRLWFTDIGRDTAIGCEFTTTAECEIDAVITALIHVRSLLRKNTKPLPKRKSIIRHGDAP